MESGTVIGLEIRPGGVNDLTARHKNDIHGFGWCMGAEQLSDQPFRSIPNDGVAQFPARGDTESRCLEPVWQGETGHEPPPQPDSALEDPGELLALAQLVRITARTRP